MGPHSPSVNRCLQNCANSDLFVECIFTSIWWSTIVAMGLTGSCDGEWGWDGKQIKTQQPEIHKKVSSAVSSILGFRQRIPGRRRLGEDKRRGRDRVIIKCTLLFPSPQGRTPFWSRRLRVRRSWKKSYLRETKKSNTRRSFSLPNLPGLLRPALRSLLYLCWLLLKLW